MGRETKTEDDIYKQGVKYFDEKNYEKAITVFTKAIELESDFSFLAYSNRGYAYFKNGDFDSAIADLNHAIKLKPDFEFAYTYRGEVYLAQKNYVQVIADFTKAININPKYARALYNRFIVYFEKGDYEKAVSDHNRAFARDSSLAGEYYEKIDFEKAIISLEAKLKIEPENTAARHNFEIVRDLVWFAKGFGPVGVNGMCCLK
jgi:tetratricopeptide (TPR) repeat protein